MLDLPGPRALPRFNVIVNNCDCHNTREVMSAFMHFCGMDQPTAIDKMMLVHNMGRAIIATAHQEVAELIALRLSTEAINYAGYGLDVSVVPVKTGNEPAPAELERPDGVFPDVNWEI